jgi:hypothetical protein
MYSVSVSIRGNHWQGKYASKGKAIAGALQAIKGWTRPEQTGWHCEIVVTKAGHRVDGATVTPDNFWGHTIWPEQ